MKPFVLVLTGTINVIGKVPFQTIVDSTTRRKQYIDNLKELFRNRVAKRIVFCDNSNEQCPESLYEHARKHKIVFEWLSFSGNIDAVERYGKGVGETEILNYAMDHSVLLGESSYFIKLTGRVKVRNLKWVICSMNDSTNWFLTYGDNKLEMIDSRLFGMRKEDYINTLYQCFQYPDELSTHSIERIYAERFIQYGVPFRSFRVYPNFKGISGGYGAEYHTSLWEEIRNSGKRWALTLGHPVLLEPTAVWQGDMRLPNVLWDDDFDFLTGKRVFICGAGRLGCRFYRFARQRCRILGWSDKKYVGKRIYGKRISDIAVLAKKDVQYVVIAAKEKNAIDELVGLLLSIGIDQTKMVFLKDLLIKSAYEQFVS